MATVKGCDVYIKKTDELLMMGGGEAPLVRLNSSYEWENSGFTGVSFIKKGGNHWLLGTKGSDIQSSETFLYYTDDINNPQWTQVNIAISSDDESFGGQIANVYDADYHDGMWVIVADTYDEVGSDNKIVLAWAYDEDIENWYFIKSFSYIDGKSEINNRVFYFENDTRFSGQWIACIYNLGGGLFANGDDPTDGTLWEQAAMADSSQSFPSYCYSVSTNDSDFFAATSGGILYTTGGFDQFQTTDLTVPTKKIFHLKPDGIQYDYNIIVTNNEILLSDTATSDFAPLITGDNLTIYDAIYHNQWILAATSLGLIGMYDGASQEEDLYTDSAVKLIAASGDYCVLLTEDQQLMKVYLTDPSDMDAPTTLAEVETTDTFSFINYEVTNKWALADAVYKKVNGAWKKADSVLFKSDGMWLPSNITPYEFAIPFVVKCQKCSDSNKFTFQLKDSNGDVVDTVNCTGANTTNNLSFQKLSFKKAGTFTYTISQVAGTDTTIKNYDDEVYTIVFTLALDSSNNAITCSDLMVTDTNGEMKETMTFTNTGSNIPEPDL